MERDIIVIAASAGGVSALQTLVAGLPQSQKASLFIVMHRPASWPGALPQILSRAGPLPVLYAAEGMVIEQGTIYVAPSTHHLTMHEGRLHVETGAKEHYVRPAARTYGARVVGVVLTGSGQDGADGLLTIKQSGGVAVVQDPQDASFPPMPLRALAAVAHHHVDYVIPLSDIAPVLIRLVSSSVEQSSAQEEQS